MNVKGRTLTLVANFERLEQRGRKTAVRLLNVRRSTGELIAARGWFAHTEAFGWLGLVEGDVVQFDAFTETAYQGERTLRLADPVHLKKLPFDLWRGLRPGGPPGEAAPEGAGIGRSGLERLTERER